MAGGDASARMGMAERRMEGNEAIENTADGDAGAGWRECGGRAYDPTTKTIIW